jgi:hypothetical protein
LVLLPSTGDLDPLADRDTYRLLCELMPERLRLGVR